MCDRFGLRPALGEFQHLLRYADPHVIEAAIEHVGELRGEVTLPEVAEQVREITSCGARKRGLR